MRAIIDFLAAIWESEFRCRMRDDDCGETPCKCGTSDWDRAQ